MKDDIMNYYIKDIKNNPVLSNEEQIQLAKKWRDTKDCASFNKLVSCNLRYVIQMANKYYKRNSNLSVPLNDFIQAGSVGLLIALNKFDPERGTTPVSFAHDYIRTELDILIGKNINMMRSLTTGKDRFVLYRRQDLFKIIEAKNEEDKDNLRNKFSKDTGLSIEDIKKQEQKYGIKVLSLSEFSGKERRENLENICSLKVESNNIINKIVSKDLHNKLNDTLNQLEPRTANFIKEMYYNEETFSNLGAKNNLTRQRADQIVKKGLNEMKDILNKKINIKDFIEE